jgi:hypothetical protein
MDKKQHPLEVEQLIVARLIRVTLMLMVLLAMLCLWHWQKIGLQLVLGLVLGLVSWLLMVRLDLEYLQDKVLLTFKANSKGESWLRSLGWFIPRKYRYEIIGDILEDCAEMREAGCTERRIKFHVVYQWVIAVVTLVPTAFKISITDILKQVLSPPK